MSDLEVFEPELLYTQDEVACALKLSKRTIEDMVYKKKIPYKKIGFGKRSPIRFLGKTLNHWLIDVDCALEKADGQQRKKAKYSANRAILKESNKALSDFNEIIAGLKKGG
jgi:excisionase family DNA binding protein